MEIGVAELSNELLAKDAVAANERDLLSKLESPVTSLSVNLQRAQAQRTTDKDL